MTKTRAAPCHLVILSSTHGEAVQNERIQWAPKVPQAKIWALYQREARGLADATLIDDVGFALYQRCQSIIMVTERRRLVCPRCAQIVSCPGERWSSEYPIVCLDCGWSASYGQYRDSWRHQDLHGGNAMYAFRAFVEGYERAGLRERMLLIDRLINAFHWSLKHSRRHGPAATQLIGGSAEQVLALLDRLAGSDSNAEQAR
jgi:hypothetical protein